MKRVLVALALAVLLSVPAAAADWYIICARLKVDEYTACLKCSGIFRVFSEKKPSGGCIAISMRPLVFATRQEALEWKRTKCTCP